MKPIILITSRMGGCVNYEAAVTAAGGIPRAVTPDMPFDPRWAEECAGLLLTGGGDIAPWRFRAKDEGVSAGIEADRDALELACVDAFRAVHRPILGICRGMQLLNTAFGGTLVQDLSPDGREIHTRTANFDLVHPTIAQPGCFLAELYGTHFATNSAHHQCVKELGAGLVLCQQSEDGVPEGFYHPEEPVWAVQWHPERMCLAHAREDTVDGLPVFRFFLAQVEGSLH